MKTFNAGKLLALALALLLALGSGAAFAEGDKTATIAVTDTIGTLNPLLMDNTEIVKYATSLAFLPLVDLNRELEFAPPNTGDPSRLTKFHRLSVVSQLISVR